MKNVVRLFLKGGFRLLVCVLLIAFGVGGFMFLKSLRKPPAELEQRETALRVEAVRVEPRDVEVTLTGYGEVRSLNTVSIAPEVSGRVVELHPNLEVGEVIPKGETLFAIDPRTYQAMVDQSRANVAQFESTIERLQTSFAQDKARMVTLSRTRELANDEFGRLKELLEKDQVGTQSFVDQAEQGYNAARDAADRLAQALEVYPIQIEEAKSGLAAAQATLAAQEVNLSRARVVAPFTARVKSVNLELDQTVQPGVPVLVLADDSVLEISVPLDSRDAQQWLQFDNAPAGNDSVASQGSWFAGLRQVKCRIRWVEDAGEHAWEGVLHRVEKFQQDTRTVWVAVRVDAADALSKGDSSLPLVEGMFCSVEFPGRKLTGVYEVPRWAVSFEGTVYVSREGRLRKVPVKVVRSNGDSAYISEGLNPGEVVVTTRLVNPLTGVLLDISEATDGENAS